MRIELTDRFVRVCFDWPTIQFRSFGYSLGLFRNSWCSPGREILARNQVSGNVTSLLASSATCLRLNVLKHLTSCL